MCIRDSVTAEENAPAVPLKEASGQFWEKNDKDEILARVSMTKSAPFVMEKMAETKRFSDVKLRCYVNEIDVYKRQLHRRYGM